MLTDESLQAIAARLTKVPGVSAVVLGGSRARGDHLPDADVDLGLYYEGAVDRELLGELARELSGDSAIVTGHGDWGPWVDGGGWLQIEGVAVDWIYRDLARVEWSIAAAQEGRIARHHQLGHPFGIPDYEYAAELALGRVLSDPSNRLTKLKSRLADFPATLRHALIENIFEAEFDLGIARKAVHRGDTVYVAGCLFQAFLVAAIAIHAASGRWVANEKGAIAASAALPFAPRDFAWRSSRILGALGMSSPELKAAIDAAADLIADTRRALGGRPV